MKKSGEILKSVGIAFAIVACATVVSVGAVALCHWLKPLVGEYALYGSIGVILLGAVSYTVYDIRKTNRAFAQEMDESSADDANEVPNAPASDDSGAVSGAVSDEVEDCPAEDESPEKGAERKFHKLCGVDEGRLLPFGDLNYVVQAWCSDDGKTATCDNYMPRKNRIEPCQFESREDLCRNLADTRERMKMAIVVIDKFIAGETNNFYYWDETSMPEGWADDKES
jgi:hypothetical protein